MKIVRASGGAFGQRLVFEEDEFDKIALQELRDANCLPAEPAPIRIDRFVEQRFRCTIDYQDLGSNALGATLFAKDGSVRGIVIGSQLATDAADKLFRSTAAHEAGHGLLHSILFIQDAQQGEFRVDNADFQNGRILCRSSDVKPGQRRGYDGRWWEYQANRMIGSLLLPRPLVAKVAGPYLQSAKFTGNSSLPAERRNEALASVAKTFEVNPIVAQIRLEEIYPSANGQQEF
jgi:hypothetical protein